VNIQQIPKNALPEDRQKDYKNCFTSGYEGWSIVGADYSAQELAVIATLSKDPVFLDALDTGKDLHSVCAELIYGEEWINAAEDTCVYYKKVEGIALNEKCKCKDHKRLRNNVKKVNFGLAYGLSPKGLAADLKITLPEAEELFTKYFITFPYIRGLLDSFGEYGKTYGYIKTIAPWSRKRYYPYWRGIDTPRGQLGQIERASKNMPIQGSSADMCKIALIGLRRWINTENYRDKVKLYVQVHDEISTICEDSIAEIVKARVTYIMEEAAKICLGNTLLKAEAEISKLW
jgi:DNA polymerase-1